MWWRKGISAMLALVCVASFCSGAAPPPRATYRNVVSPVNAWDLQPYNVQPAETQAVLETTPAGGSSFVPKSGKVASCERHGGQPWVIGDNTAAMCKALSPPIPANTASQVICIGQFAVAGGPGPAPGNPPVWRSDLYKPGVHVIVVNLYNRDSSIDVPEGSISLNDSVNLAADALKEKYRNMDTNGRTVYVKCGLGGNIQKFADLPAYLAGLTPPAANNSVVTYDTLGHGAHFTRPPEIGSPFTIFMECARSGADEMDMVGLAADWQILQALPEPPSRPPATMHFMATTAYAGIIAPFLTDTAIVNLDHCYTGDGYKFYTAADYNSRQEDKPSIAQQLKGALPAGVRVMGIAGYISFPITKEIVLHPPPDFYPRGRVPAPDAGSTWVAFPGP